MADTLRESMEKLPKRVVGPTWKPKLPKGVISQETFDTTRGKKASFKQP